MEIELEFKEHMLLESKNYFVEKITDVMTALTELLKEKSQIGARNLISASESIVAGIRKILHSSWKKSYKKYLYVLQKIGTSIMVTIEEKGDLKNTLVSCQSELQKILKKLAVPINNL